VRIPSSLLALSLAACLGSDAIGPAADRRESGPSPSNAGGAVQMTAFGQNVYVGTDVDAVLPALLSPDPTDDLPALLHAVAVLQETDFTARAAGIAAEIDRTRPHAVGFNEISRIDVDLSPLGIPVVVHEDFLAELLAALAARGLDYAVAAEMQGFVAAPPLPAGAQVQVLDSDVLLVDASRVTVGPGTIERNYSANVGPVAPGVTLIRSFVIVPLVVEGRSHSVAATHLEANIAGLPPLDLLRAAQATELLAYLPAGEPAILLGDFNDVPGSPMHQVLAGAGFADLWATLHPQRDGFTCCNSANLSDHQAAHTKRIDYVFARGLGGPQGSLIGRIDRYGVTRSDLVAGPLHSLWPSDHAGLVATLVSPPPTMP
jgi:hypothetical protein